MRQKIRFLLAAGIVPLAATASAQSFSDHLYVTGDMGAALEQSLRIRGGGDLINFNTGIRGDVALGYHVNSWLAAEFASGVIWNSGDTIGGATFSSFGAAMDLYQIPVMGNGVFSSPEWHGLKAYAGGGLGGVAGMLDFQRPLGAIRDTDFTFSYQAFAGLNYRLSPRMELGLGYKFLQTGDHDWAENGVTLKTQGSGTHSITLSFTWNFSGTSSRGN